MTSSPIEVKKGDPIGFELPTSRKTGASFDPTAFGTVDIFEGLPGPPPSINQVPIVATVVYTQIVSGLAGVNIVQIDTSQATFVVGNQYFVVVKSMTIDTELVNPMIGTFVMRSQGIDDILGGSLSLRAEWKWDTDTTATDPGSGNVKADNATYTAVTEIYIHQESNKGFNASSVLDELKAGDFILIAQKNDPSNFLAGSVTGAATDNGLWYTIPVTIANEGGSIGNNQTVDVGFLLIPVPVWTEPEKAQLRYRGQIDGTQTAPTTDAPTQLPIDVQAIFANPTSAENLSASAQAIIPATVQAGATTTSVTINSAFVGSLVGRNIAFYTGTILNEAASIGTSVAAGGNTTVTFVDAAGDPASLSAAPTAGDLCVVL